MGITAADFAVIRAALGQQAEDDIAWAEECSEPMMPETLKRLLFPLPFKGWPSRTRSKAMGDTDPRYDPQAVLGRQMEYVLRLAEVAGFDWPNANVWTRGDELRTRIACAFEIADAAMLLKLRNNRLHIENTDWRVHGIQGIHCAKTLADANPYVKEAVEWLRDRGYIEIRNDDWGVFVRVLREPGSGE